MKALFIGALAVAVTGSAITAEGDTAKALVDQMHVYYVKQFENLEMTKEGNFGLARVESGQIKSHTKKGGAPGYIHNNFMTSVSIYGAHGKPLTTANIESRYHRMGGAHPANKRPLQQPKKSVSMDKLAKRAVSHWSKGQSTALVETDGVNHFEARPLLLSKKECLSCHTGMKLKQPVAVIIYKLTPLVSLKG